MFNRNDEEIGDTNKNLILKGKVKILWGKKLIDLLDRNGNLNVKLLPIIKNIHSESEMTQNGFYFCNEKLIAKINDYVLLISENKDDLKINTIQSTDYSDTSGYKISKNEFNRYNLDIDDINIRNEISYNEDSLNNLYNNYSDSTIPSVGLVKKLLSQQNE